MTEEEAVAKTVVVYPNHKTGGVTISVPPGMRFTLGDISNAPGAILVVYGKKGPNE